MGRRIRLVMFRATEDNRFTFGTAFRPFILPTNLLMTEFLLLLLKHIVRLLRTRCTLWCSACRYDPDDDERIWSL